jgi:integrase/recombinase XerD
MLALSVYSGMRACEIAALDIANVLTTDGEIKDVISLTRSQTKGNKAREVFLNSKAKSHIKGYTKTLGNKSGEQAFFSPEGKWRRFTANSMVIAFRNFYKTIGMEGYSSHSGRRSFCSTLANKGVNIRVIQRLSGHRSLQSVQPYLDANEEMVKQAVELL